jgi:hypothetical protein
MEEVVRKANSSCGTRFDVTRRYAGPWKIGGLTVAHRWRNFDRIATSAITYAVAAIAATGVYDWSL